MNDSQRSLNSNRLPTWIVYAIAIVMLYPFSSGPVIGIGMLLRDLTGSDLFLVVLILYYPLFKVGESGPIEAYVDWWVEDVFRTHIGIF